ncbi:MAG: hypothetical protein LC749_21800 [Actinobacteria bacterium]|nr:hypothetical protein [Actinomycetota bacterium]
MAARFFVDENDLALGKALSERYGNVLFPGHPDLPEVPRQSADDVWLEVVGAQGLVVVTRDKRIRYRPIERRRWVEHAVRGFVLTGKTSQSTIDSLSLLGQRWEEVTAVLDAHPEGPWMYSVTRVGVRQIALA